MSDKNAQPIEFDFMETQLPLSNTEITIPAIRINMNGTISIYRVDSRGCRNVRFAKKGQLVGVEFLPEPTENTRSLRIRKNVIDGGVKTLPTYIGLEEAIGTEFFSALFELHPNADLPNQWWFDLGKATKKRRTPKKRSSRTAIKALKHYQ